MIGPLSVMLAKLAYSNSFGRVSITHWSFTASHQQCERQRTKSPDEHRGGDNDFPSITKQRSNAGRHTYRANSGEYLELQV